MSVQQDIRNVEPAPSIAKLPLVGAVALAIVSGLFGGVVGLLMVGVMWWISSNPWVRDDPDSHGISEQDSSRLGGFIIAVGYIVFTFLSSYQFLPSNELGQGFVSPLVSPQSLVLCRSNTTIPYAARTEADPARSSKRPNPRMRLKMRKGR